MPLDAHATEEEDKLILLSSLSRLGGCTQEQLLRFLAESGLMNPFQFYLALGGLKEAGFIREARHMEGALLFLTPQGHQSAGQTILRALAEPRAVSLPDHHGAAGGSGYGKKRAVSAK